MSKNPDITAKELSEACGGRLPNNVAEALLKYLRYA